MDSVFGFFQAHVSPEAFIARVQLKKVAGKINCPFHDDKTASMHVYESNFYCFSCGKTTDAFGMYAHLCRPGLGFQEQVRAFAADFNLNVEPFFDKSKSVGLDLYQVGDILAKYYETAFWSLTPFGASAREYIANRLVLDPDSQLFSDVCRQYQIGVSPGRSFYPVSNFPQAGNPDFQFKVPGLLKEFYSQAVLGNFLYPPRAESQGSMSYADPMRDRIVFPIRDHRGRTIGFTGRIFKPADGRPNKYSHTRKSSIFKSSSSGYGYPEALTRQAKQASRADKVGIVFCEGPMDVLALALIDIPAISLLGTGASAPEPLKRVASMGIDIGFCFDSDTAGLTGSLKASSFAFAHMKGSIDNLSVFKFEHDPADDLAESRSMGIFNHDIRSKRMAWTDWYKEICNSEVSTSDRVLRAAANAIAPAVKCMEGKDSVGSIALCQRLIEIFASPFSASESARDIIGRYIDSEIAKIPDKPEEAVIPVVLVARQPLELARKRNTESRILALILCGQLLIEREDEQSVFLDFVYDTLDRSLALSSPLDTLNGISCPAEISSLPIFAMLRSQELEAGMITPQALLFHDCASHLAQEVLSQDPFLNRKLLYFFFLEALTALNYDGKSPDSRFGVLERIGISRPFVQVSFTETGNEFALELTTYLESLVTRQVDLTLSEEAAYTLLALLGQTSNGSRLILRFLTKLARTELSVFHSLLGKRNTPIVQSYQAI